MTALLRQKLFKDDTPKKPNEMVYTLDDFEETFAFTKKMVKMLGITHPNDKTSIRTICLNIYFMLEVVNISLATPSELVKMTLLIKTARGFNDVLKVFRTLPCFGACVLSIIKFLKMKYNRTAFEALFNELRDMWPQGEVTEEQHRIISPTFKQLKLIIKSYYWCNNLLMVSFFFVPLGLCYNRYRGLETRMELAFDYWLPFNPFQPYILEIMLLLQFWAAMVVLWFNVLWEMMFCTYLAHITMQFNMLAYRIRRLVYVPIDRQLDESYPLAQVSKELLRDEEDVVRSYSADDWEVRYRAELIAIVKRHLALIRMAGEVETIYSIVLLVNFLYSSIMICFNGFCSVLLERWNEVAYKTFLVTALAQTWLLCWYGQQLLDASTNVSLALYNSGWYMCSQRIKTTVLMMLRRAQKDVHVTTYGFSIVSLMSFSTIVKTSWSYFTLLLNFYTNIANVDTVAE